MKQKWKYLILGCWISFISFFSYGQCNLIKNPSFEQYSACPNGNNNIYLANTWNAIDNNTSDTSECNGEYWNACANSIGGDYYGVPGPGSYLNYQYAHSGNAYVGIDLYCNSPLPRTSRTYAKGNLIQTLATGKTYCFKMWINLANMSKYQCNNMMTYFDNGSIDTAKCGYPIAITPQIINTPNVAITDTLNWVLVSGSFVANGTENTVTIGNFYTNAQSQMTVFNTNGFWSNTAYYLIDDVSLIPIDLAPFAGNDTSIAHGDSVYVGRPSEIGLDDDCTWYILGNSTPIDTIAGMWVKPAATTSYVLEQSICGTISYDTVKVSVNPLGIKQYESSNTQVYVYPNPAKDLINVSCNVENTELTIIDVLGNIVIQQKAATKTISIDISNLNEGVYFIQLNSTQGITTKKIIIQH